jgi:hypothetical protein
LLSDAPCTTSTTTVRTYQGANICTLNAEGMQLLGSGSSALGTFEPRLQFFVEARVDTEHDRVSPDCICRKSGETKFSKRQSFSQLDLNVITESAERPGISVGKRLARTPGRHSPPRCPLYEVHPACRNFAVLRDGSGKRRSRRRSKPNAMQRLQSL